MTSTAAMEAGSASVERLLAAAAATMEKARYCWAMTVAEDGSVNARPMGPQKSPASEDPFGILFLTRRSSRKALEIGRTGRLSVVYQHDGDDSYVTLIGRGVIIADRALLRARWQPAWNQFFPAGADDETSHLRSARSRPHRALGARRDAGAVRDARRHNGARSRAALAPGPRLTTS